MKSILIPNTWKLHLIWMLNWLNSFQLVLWVNSDTADIQVTSLYKHSAYTGKPYPYFFSIVNYTDYICAMSFSLSVTLGIFLRSLGKVLLECGHQPVRQGTILHGRGAPVP